MTASTRTATCWMHTLALVFLLLIGATNSAVAQSPTFGPEQLIGNVNGAHAIGVADLDGDGWLDVLMGGDGPADSYWAAGGPNGLGPSTAVGPLNLQQARQAITAADLDGNGHPDIIMGRRDGATLLSNLGGATWGPKIDLGSPSAPSAFFNDIEVVDLDGDAIPDILVHLSDHWTGSISQVGFFQNLGGMTFGAFQVLSSTTPGGQAVHAADLDGDGDMDVLSANAMGWDYRLNLTVEGSPGVFGPAQMLATGIARDILTADVDADGDLDIIAQGASLDWFESRFNETGTVSFGPARLIASRGAFSVAAGDIDNDGDTDLVTNGFNEVVLYTNLACGGSFAPPRILVAMPPNSNARRVVLADMNQNGYLDVLYSAHGLTTCSLIYNQGASCSFDICGLNVGSDYQITITNSDCTPNALHYNAISVNAGAFPGGWFYGIDITTSELVAQLGSGVAPFMIMTDAAGQASTTITLPSVVGPFGIDLYGVAVELSGFVPVGASGPIFRTI